MKKYALLSAGEILIDLLGAELSNSLLDARAFEKIQGGSPANLAANMARLGGQVALVACVGNDNLGVFLRNEIEKTGINSRFVAVSNEQPTSIVVVSRTKATPDFIAYRMADRMLLPEHITDETLSQAAIFHTTCFALSQNPAQNTLVDAARRANALGCQVSIDANYAPSIWPNREEAWRVLSEYCSYGAFVKLSEDDAERLYGREDMKQEEILSDFHDMGASLVCFTLGGKGSVVSWEGGKEQLFLAPQKIEVIDATGAGDAFWSGFLTAYNDAKTIEQCAEAASRMAVRKLTHQGPLPSKVAKAFLYE